MSQRHNTGTPATITGTILQSIPAEAQITRVEYEGPRIALYTKNPTFLQQNNYIIADIVNTVKRRVVIRTEKAVRREEGEAREIIANLLPKDAEVVNMFFDECLGEVLLEAKRPQVLTLEGGFDVVNITAATGWRVKVRKAPHVNAASIQNIYFTLKTSSDERERFYRDIGERIFRPKISSESEVTMLTLGGFRQVGRSAMLIGTAESKILLDCGIHPGARNPRDAYPRIDWTGLSLDELDAVIISHAHLDHTGFLPALFKYGYDGPVYCTEPTLPLMTMLHMDSIKIASMEGANLLYEMRDVREVIGHTIPLPYGLVTDVSPDVKVVLSNAGHILGSATVHLHIGEGEHNIVYTGDYKFGTTQLFESAVWNYPRVETLITESTYGAKEDIMPPREEVELNFVNTMNQTISEGGKVLIPVPAVGRAQEIILVLDQYMRQGKLIETPIFVEGMISEATAIHISFADYLARELRSRILETDENPFVSDYFTVIEHPESRHEALREGPAIIVATSGMLEGGPVIQYFQELAPNEKNKIVFVSYQINGTLGRRILDGARQASMMAENGKIKIIDIKCKVEKVEGFSGHSDYNQIIRYVGRIRPKLQQVIVNHGERRKVENVSYMISRLFRIPTLQPDVREAIKIY